MSSKSILWSDVSALLVLLGGAIIEQALGNDGDSICLLQMDMMLERQHQKAHGDGKWFMWEDRLPGIIKANDSNNSASDLADVWTHLGDKWWMEFIDGQFHKDGPHVLDHTKTNDKNGQDGKVYEHSKELYMQYSALAQWKYPTTADSMEHINAVHKGASCQTAPCLELYLAPWSLTLGPEVRRKRMQGLLAEYYNGTAPLLGLDRRSRLRKGLPHLAKLFGAVAALHPFKDANSRTRVMLMQTELVRLGGHPAILWGFRENVYAMCGYGAHSKKNNGSDDYNCDIASIQNLLLNGWCAWEIAAATGKSPFEAGEYVEPYDPVTESCLLHPQPKPEPVFNTVRQETEQGVLVRD